MSDPLERLAHRVAGDPQFLAAGLATYARAERLNDAALADELGGKVEDLTALRLCRAPRPDPAGFREDVRLIADRFGLDVVRLMAVVRRGEALGRLRGAAAGGPGSLLAARDHTADEPPPTGGSPP
jgi:hypothetical protein